MTLRSWRALSAGFLALTALTACNQTSSTSTETVPLKEDVAADYWPAVSFTTANHERVEARVEALLSEMTLKQKVAQVIQPEIRDITVEDMREYGFGSYLNGGGAFPNNDKHATVQDWVDLAEALYQASVDDSVDGSRIPTMWGTDAVHGHNNVIGATLFPHNIGLGAARDPELIKRIAEATAKEVRATGIDWIFAPTVAVARDDRWGRTYESYSEDPAVVGQYARAIVSGLQGDIRSGAIDDGHVISTVKHFLGDGGTEGGDDQGNNIAEEETLFRIHAQGYVEGLNAGAQSVMASFNSWQGNKIHGSKYLLTSVLKDKMGFDGFVVGDWNGHGQIEGCTNDNCPQAINAGLDVYMVPTSAWKPLFHNLVAQVEEGVISLDRLDDAVRRVLRVKVRAGLLDAPSPKARRLSGKTYLIGAPEHREIAREAVRKSLVMLKNKQGLLPLSPSAKVLVAGDGAHNIGKQSGGWSVTWQGTGNENSDFPGGTSIFDGISKVVEAAGGQAVLSKDGQFSEKPDVAIVVYGEDPYAEGNGDLANVEFQRGQKTDLALLQRLQQAGIPVVSVFLTGRPLWVNAELNASDAFVVAWLPGSEGEGVADVLFTDESGQIKHPLTGKLSFSWPADPNQNPINAGDGKTPLFPLGYGLSFGEADPLSSALPETYVTDANTAPDSHPVYVLTTQKPWSFAVMDGQSPSVMNSNVLQTESVQVRTTDREVQEDSLEIQWLSGGTQVGFMAAFPEDLLNFAGSQGALVFDIKLENPAGELFLSMACGENCAATLPLADYLKPTSEWQQVVVPSQCLINAGARFGEIFAPFVLESTKAGKATISNVQLVAEQPGQHSCPR
ncbi:glycoside hydrolase family 3 protein [Alteromonas aestuariivivens]|uniref:Glycoside hydrolase family 3 protein n=1 Tax=Alteromonas aestuariivivens TaxID=1938339 RepID=A0A3D8MAF0_9ALTE|nr:glycoside hydrolase family 3 N-terminal domain-containing protein [Alteromonas aestuariivivens]RDV26794.1 glycoside hydrolase family 3 protein [Alteromonas aestuariivivens]